MPGENIFVADNSVAVQELCRATLEGNGYRVTVASNGVAAISYPDIGEADLLILDLDMREVSGFDTARMIKSDKELFRKPILLLVPEEEASDRVSQDLLGANSWLKKPFEPSVLLAKVGVMLEEKQILENSREYLREAAESMMKKLADTFIQQAVEQKTQIIVERALQLVVTQVDQKARREVDARVTQLTAEKQEELVKMTVHEVARSMVEKLAERKVAEAMEAILRDETEKCVRRVADSVIPGLTRDRIRESIEQVLPKEIQRRVQKEAENLVPEASQKVVSLIDAAAQKIVPKIARDLTSEVVGREVAQAIDVQLPKHVQTMVSQELEAQVRLKMAPFVKEAADSVNTRTRRMGILMIAVFVVSVILLGVFQLYGPRGRAADSKPPAPEAAVGNSTQNSVSKFLQQVRSKEPGR